MNPWPKLDYSEWKLTYETLHRWVQIVGKLRLCKTPWINHSWNSTLYLTSRGLTTSPIPLSDRTLSVEFDFIDHKLHLLDSLGKALSIPLRQESVADFYQKFRHALGSLDVTTTFEPTPNELSDATPFEEDRLHRTYDPTHAQACFQVMTRVHNVLQEFRSNYVGKSSPVHFFWGSFDLAVTRFSGRRAPEHPGGVPHLSDEVVREAYSHEVMSCGFWPGNEVYPEAAFYAYAYPEPVGFAKTKIQTPGAFYHADLREFVLPYEAVRTAPDPAKMLLGFCEETYRIAANTGAWDRDMLEVSPHLSRLKELSRSSFSDEAIRQ